MIKMTELDKDNKASRKMSRKASRKASRKVVRKVSSKRYYKVSRKRSRKTSRKVSSKRSLKVYRKRSRKVSHKASRKVVRKVSRKVVRKVSRKVSKVSRKRSRKGVSKPITGKSKKILSNSTILTNIIVTGSGIVGLAALGGFAYYKLRNNNKIQKKIYILQAKINDYLLLVKNDKKQIKKNNLKNEIFVKINELNNELNDELNATGIPHIQEQTQQTQQVRDGNLNDYYQIEEYYKNVIKYLNTKLKTLRLEEQRLENSRVQIAIEYQERNRQRELREQDIINQQAIDANVFFNPTSTVLDDNITRADPPPPPPADIVVDPVAAPVPAPATAPTDQQIIDLARNNLEATQTVTRTHNNLKTKKRLLNGLIKDRDQDTNNNQTSVNRITRIEHVTQEIATLETTLENDRALAQTASNLLAEAHRQVAEARRQVAAPQSCVIM